MDAKTAGEATKVNNAWVSGNISYYKRGNVVFVKISNFKTSNNITSETVVATIPAGYRPPQEIYASSHKGTGKYMSIYGGGNISVYESLESFYSVICYPVWG